MIDTSPVITTTTIVLGVAITLSALLFSSWVDQREQIRKINMELQQVYNSNWEFLEATKDSVRLLQKITRLPNIPTEPKNRLRYQMDLPMNVKTFHDVIKHTLQEVENMNDKLETLDLQFVLSREQQECVCEKFGKNIKDLQDYEICELLDLLIDTYCA